MLHDSQNLPSLLVFIAVLLITNCKAHPDARPDGYQQSPDLRGFHAEPVAPSEIFFKERMPVGSDALDSSLTNQADRKSLIDNLEVMKKSDSRYGFIISGHTDNMECKKEECAELSLRRASLVREWLVRNGLNTMRMKPAVGYGDKRPIGPNNTEQGRSQNRRVSIDILFMP